MQINKLEDEKNIYTFEIIIPREEADRLLYQTYLIKRHHFSKQGERVALDQFLKLLSIRNWIGMALESIQDDINDQILNQVDGELFSKIYYTDAHIDEDGLHVTCEFAAKPEVEIADYAFPLEEPIQVEISEDELNRALDEIVKDNARLTPVNERIKKGNIVNVDISITALDENGVPATLPYENMNIEIGNLPESLAQLIGDKEGRKFLRKRVGRTINFTPAFQLPYNIERISATIRQVYEAEYPELDDELAEEISEFDTLEELKEDLKENLKNNQENLEWRELINNRMEILENESKPEFPESVLLYMQENDNDPEMKRMLEQMRRIPFSSFVFEEETDLLDYLSSVESNLVVDAVADNIGLDISDEKYDEYFKNIQKAKPDLFKDEDYNRAMQNLYFDFINQVTAKTDELTPEVINIVKEAIRPMLIQGFIREDLMEKLKEN